MNLVAGKTHRTQ